MSLQFNIHQTIVGAIAVLGLAGCAADMPTGEVTTREVTSYAVELPAELPPMKAFAGSRIDHPSQPNGEIAADFLDLSFALESGRALPVLSRFEGPVSLKVSGGMPAAAQGDLDRLLSRLRIEAGIDIREVSTAATPSINLEFISKRELKRLVPTAACFVAPNVSSWAEYKSARHSATTDWTRLTERSRMSVFIPRDVSPQEIRDCLHEEIAQALGPVNDLYRLSDSVFNDDNFHTVLTGYDMLILRAYYARELHSGMTKGQVARLLPTVLARLNPSGGSGVPFATSPEPAAWKEALEAALGGAGSLETRRNAARRAVDLARAYNWRDTRLAFSLFAYGRLLVRDNTDLALAAFREAEQLYGAHSDTALQAAHMGVQLAAHALSLGNAETAIQIVDSHIGAVTNAENAALLSTLMMIKAEALSLTGRDPEAQLVRLDSIGWARYGFGSEAEVGARLDQIAAIAPGGRS